MKQSSPTHLPSCLTLLTISTLFLNCESGPSLLRGIQRHHKSASSSSWAAYFQANNENFNFWSEEWAVTKTQLVRLSLLNGVDPVKRTGAAKKSASDDAAERLRTANSTVKLKMLKSSVEYAQSRVAHLNSQEQKSLKRFTEQEAAHMKRQADIDARYHNKTLIAEFYQSNTHEETRQWTSWQSQRKRQQEQFPESMKIQQGAIQNAKLLIDSYEKHPTTSNSAQLQEAQKSMKSFCHEAWEEVKRQQDRLDDANLMQI